MVAFLVAYDINVQVIAILKLVAIRDAVADDVVDTGADALGKMVEADRRRVRAVGDDVVVN